MIFFFRDLEIWKTHRTFWKKATFSRNPSKYFYQCYFFGLTTFYIFGQKFFSLQFWKILDIKRTSSVIYLMWNPEICQDPPSCDQEDLVLSFWNKLTFSQTWSFHNFPLLHQVLYILQKWKIATIHFQKPQQRFFWILKLVARYLRRNKL